MPGGQNTVLPPLTTQHVSVQIGASVIPSSFPRALQRLLNGHLGRVSEICACLSLWAISYNVKEVKTNQEKNLIKCHLSIKE